jgi:hypothetical protein
MRSSHRAVKAAVESGELDADRFEHYRKLEREAQANELRHDEHGRRQAEPVWGQLSDEVAQLRKWRLQAVDAHRCQGWSRACLRRPFRGSSPLRSSTTLSRTRQAFDYVIGSLPTRT